MSCPTGFSSEGTNCTYNCPKGFKKTTQNDKTSCVYETNNAYYVDLVKIPNSSPPNTFTNEENRVEKNIFDILKKIKTDIDTKKEIEGQYLGNKEYSPVENAYTEAIAKLTPFRPHTAPSSDLEKERRAIEKDSAIDLLVIQIVLFGIVISLVIYLIVPMEYAHTIVFFVLVVTIAVGIFLKK